MEKEFIDVVEELAQNGNLNLVEAIEFMSNNQRNGNNEELLRYWLLAKTKPTIEQCERLGTFQYYSPIIKFFESIPNSMKTEEFLYNCATCGSLQMPAQLEVWDKVLELKPKLAFRLWIFLTETVIPQQTEAKFDAVRQKDKENNKDEREGVSRYCLTGNYISEDVNNLLPAILATNKIHWKRVMHLAYYSQLSVGGTGHSRNTHLRHLYLWLLRAPEKFFPYNFKERLEVLNIALKNKGFAEVYTEFKADHVLKCHNALCEYLFATDQVTLGFLKQISDHTDEIFCWELFSHITENTELAKFSNEILLWFGSNFISARVFREMKRRYEAKECSIDEITEFLLNLHFYDKDVKNLGIDKLAENVAKTGLVPTPLLIQLGQKYENIGNLTTKLLVNMIGGLNSEVFGKTAVKQETTVF